MHTKAARGGHRALIALSLLLAIGSCDSTTGQPNVDGVPSMSTSGTPSSSQTPFPSQAPSVTPTPSASTRAPAPVPCLVPARLRGQDLSRLPVTDKAIALTFDGGSNAAGVRSNLDTLAAHHVPATFFLTGRFVRTYPRVSARVAREHLVGNHTDTHPDLTRLSDAAATSEVRTAQRSIRSVTGEDPRRFFRFPFGARTPHKVSLLNQLCYVPFRWTVDTLGWQGTSSGSSVTSVTNRVMSGASPGAIILMHVGAHPKDGSTLDADALPLVIRRLDRAGYDFVRLSRVLREAP
jgi:peptidoglycan/xylan/chitin deacetylase (PgdA/CDA1 family)